MTFKSKLNYATNFPFIKVIASIILGVVVAIYVIQQQKAFKLLLGSQARQFVENSLNCAASFEIAQIDIFKGSLVLKNISMHPKTKYEQNWSWGCDELIVSFSWLYLLTNGRFKAKFIADQLKFVSLYEHQKLAISPHLYNLFLAPSPIPVELKSLKIKNGKATVLFKEPSLNFCFNWNSKTKTIANLLKSNIYFKAGNLTDQNISYLDQLAGYLQISLPLNATSEISTNCNLCFKAPYFNTDDKYFLIAKWEQNQGGSCKLSSLNGTADFTPTTLQLDNDVWHFCTKGHLALTLLQKFFPNTAALPLGGKALINLDAKITNNDYTLSGSCYIEKLQLNSKLLLDELNLTFTHSGSDWNGNIFFGKKETPSTQGTWFWDEKHKTGDCKIYNNMKINLPFDGNWEIKPHDLVANFKFTKHANLFDLTGNYTTIFTNCKSNLSQKLAGFFKQNSHKLYVTGNIDQDRYQATFDTAIPCIKNIALETSSGTKICTILQKNNSPNELETILDLELVNKWLPIDLHNLIAGQGKLIINTSLYKNQILNKIELENGNLIIPKIYNVIKALSCNADFDLANKCLSIKNAKVTLHKGQLKIPQATLHFANNYTLDYTYLPVIFNNCAINFERNLITNVSGKILYQKDLAMPAPLLKGFIILEQTLCKYNVLSNDMQAMFGNAPAPYSKIPLNPVLDLNLFTLSPIKIQSEYLETNASAKIHLSNNLLNPQITGHISIAGGKINFPHKPLYITNGHIYFTAEQSHQPMLDLIAKNQIKRHNITLHLSGSINHPYINLESSPSLTEEQIGALLLVGTENTTLNMIMPAIIMQNLNNIIFGSIYHEEQTSNLLKTFFKPLDHVKFIPGFSDETGRGGLRGAVEIDVNDRLHAIIQKNFSLSEDTKIEIDYSITDDVSIRGIKDERGDLGGEIEIRLKI